MFPEGSFGTFHEDRTLADTLAEVMELRTADLAFGDDLDFCNPRSMEREHPLDTFTVRDFPNGESGVDTSAAFGNDDTRKDLDTLFAPFDNAAVHLDRVSDIEFCNVLLELLLLDFFDDIHDLVRKVC